MHYDAGMGLRDVVTVGRYMTSSPHTIGRTQTLATAHEVMRNHDIRHLPVLDGGALVGIVSQRDLHLVETLRDIDPATVRVEEAMTLNPYTTMRDTPLAEVAERMAERRIGSAIIVDANGRIEGVFTAVDAMRALAELLQ